MRDRGRMVLSMVVACAPRWRGCSPRRPAPTTARARRSSAHPKAPDGFVAISELEVPGVALH